MGGEGDFSIKVVGGDSSITQEDSQTIQNLMTPSYFRLKYNTHTRIIGYSGAALLQGGHLMYHIVHDNVIVPTLELDGLEGLVAFGAGARGCSVLE